MALIDIPRGKVVGSEIVTLDSTTVEKGLTPSVYGASGRGATAAVLVLRTDAADITLDGSDPNSAAAIRTAAADVIILRDPDQIAGFRGVKITNNVPVHALYIR